MWKRFLLKLSYSVEIGAYLAYVGHTAVTGDREIGRIAREELRHMVMLKRIMAAEGTAPSFAFNLIFFLIGSSIKATCFVVPKVLLDPIAAFLEIINVVNYGYMSRLMPEYAEQLNEMQRNEEEHGLYFKTRGKGYRLSIKRSQDEGMYVGPQDPEVWHEQAKD
jgi:hypothetical protein